MHQLSSESLHKSILLFLTRIVRTSYPILPLIPVSEYFCTYAWIPEYCTILKEKYRFATSKHFYLLNLIQIINRSNRKVKQVSANHAKKWKCAVWRTWKRTVSCLCGVCAYVCVRVQAAWYKVPGSGFVKLWGGGWRGSHVLWDVAKKKTSITSSQFKAGYVPIWKKLVTQIKFVVCSRPTTEKRDGVDALSVPNLWWPLTLRRWARQFSRHVLFVIVLSKNGLL